MDFCDVQGTIGDQSPSGVHAHACAFVRLRSEADQQRWALLFNDVVIVNTNGFSIMRYSDVCAILYELATLDTDADDLFFMQYILTTTDMYNMMMELEGLDFDKTRAPMRVVIARAQEALRLSSSAIRDRFHLDSDAFLPLGIDPSSELRSTSAWAHLTYGMLAEPSTRSMQRAAHLEYELHCSSYALCAPRGDGDALNEGILRRTRRSTYSLVADRLFKEGYHANENAMRFARALGKVAMPAPLRSFHSDCIARADAFEEDVAYAAHPTRREEQLVLTRLCAPELLYAYPNLQLALHDVQQQPQMREHLEQLLRTARQGVVFRLYALDALNRVLRDHAAWLRLSSVSELPARERVAALCSRLAEAAESSTFSSRTSSSHAAPTDALHMAAPVSKGSAWAVALAEAKASPACTTLVHEIVQLLGASPIDKVAVFALLLRGRDAAEDDSHIVPKQIPAISPAAVLVQAAWSKIEFALIDRRLQPISMLMQHLGTYVAAGSIAVAQRTAVLPEKLDNLRLPELMDTLRRPGKEWGDESKGINIVTQLYVPVWRREHSRLASDSPLPSDGADPYHNTQYLGKAMPYLRQLLHTLGLPFHGSESLYALFKETLEIMTKYETLGPAIRETVLTAGANRLRAGQKALGEAYDLLRYSGDLRAKLPTITMNRTSDEENHWHLVLRVLTREEEDSLKERVLYGDGSSGSSSYHARSYAAASSSGGGDGGSSHTDAIAEAIAANTKAVKRLAEDIARDGKKGKQNEKPDLREKLDGKQRGLSNDDVFDMFKGARGEHHLVRFTPTGKPLEAYPVDYKGAKKQLPKDSCVLRQLCRSLKRKGGDEWCEDRTKPGHESTGGAHAACKGFKPSLYVDRSSEKRITAAMAIAAIVQGARCESPTASYAVGTVAAAGGINATATVCSPMPSAASASSPMRAGSSTRQQQQPTSMSTSMQSLLDNDNGTRWQPSGGTDETQSPSLDRAAAMLFTQAEQVVNVDRKGICDVLVDRSTAWGNRSHPLRKQGTDAERLQAVTGFTVHLLRDEVSMSKARSQLAGKILGCHCAPKLCHAHALAFVANASAAQIDALRRELPAPSGSKAVAVTGAAQAAVDALSAQGVRDAMHPKSTVNSTYVECAHGWVLVRGHLDKSIEQRCQRVECVASARAWWKANRAAADDAIKHTKGFEAAAPWTNTSAAVQQRNCATTDAAGAQAKRQRTQIFSDGKSGSGAAAAAKLVIIGSADPTAAGTQVISLVWPGALASPFLPDPQEAVDGTLAAYEELLDDPDTTELATIAELHSVLLVDGAEGSARQHAQRRVEAMQAAVRLIELGAAVHLRHDGTEHGRRSAEHLKVVLARSAAAAERPLAAATATSARAATGIKSAIRSKGAPSKKTGKRVAFAAGLLASAQALPSGPLSPICTAAPTLHLPVYETCTVVVPVLLEGGSVSTAVAGARAGREPNLYALTPTAHSSIFGQVDGTTAATASSTHDSAVQRALGFACKLTDEPRPVALLAGEIDVGHAPDGKVQKMRVVALPLTTPPDAAQPDGRPFGWLVSDTSDEQAAWRSLDSAEHDPQLFAIVASAMQRVQSHVCTAQLAPEQLHVGSSASPVLGARHMAANMRAGPSFDELLARSTRLALTFQRKLREVDGDECFRRFCGGMADRVQLPQIDEIASVFRGELPSYEGIGLERLPFARPCQPPSTAPMPKPSPRPLPSFRPEPPAAIDPNDPIEQIRFEIGADGLPILGDYWPRSIRDVVRPWARAALLRRMRDIAAWHDLRKQGLTEEECVARGRGRPRGLAFGDDATYPIARGRVWSFAQLAPQGDGLVRDISSEDSRVTHIQVAKTRRLLVNATDRAIIDFGCGGATLSLDAVLPLWSYVMPPLLSLYAPFEGTGGTFADAIARETPKICERGWCELADFEQDGELWLFTWPYRCDAQGAVPKPRASPPEPRGVVDKSGPHEEQLQLSAMPKKFGGAVRKPAPTAPFAPSLNKLDEEHYTLYEPKPSTKVAATNHAILRSLADTAQLTLLVIVWDYYKFFHQFLYVVSERWAMGRLVPTPDDDGKAGALRLARDLVLVMGVHSASKYAQRFVDTVHAEFMRCFYENNRDSFGLLPTATQRMLRWRDENLEHDAYGSHANLLDIQTYLDDPCACMVDDPATASRSMAFVRLLYEFIGPLGINLLFAEWSKWDIGVDAKWLGVTHAPALGLVLLTRDRAMRALQRTQAALRGELAAYPFQRLVGLFVSLVDACGLDRRMLFFLQGPLRRGGELEQGEDVLVRVYEHEGLARTLRKWEEQLLHFPGSVMLAAVRRSPPPRAARRLFLRSDAAVEGTEHPGLGGVLLSSWWRFALTGVLLELPMPIHEQVAYGANFVVYASELKLAPLIVSEADASATPAAVGGNAHADGMRTVAELITSMAEYQAVADRLEMEHAFGASNVFADAASRGYIGVIEMLGAQLGMRMQRRRLNLPVLRYLALAYARVLRERRIPLHRLPAELRALGVSPACDAHDGPSATGRYVSSSDEDTTPQDVCHGAKRSQLARRAPPPPVKRTEALVAASSSIATLSSSDDERAASPRYAPPARDRSRVGTGMWAPPPIAPDTPPAPKYAPPPPPPARAAEAPPSRKPPTATADSTAGNGTRSERVSAHPHIRMRADNLYAKLRADKSVYALAVDDDELDSMCLFMAGQAEGDDDEEDRARDPFNSTAWRKWTAYCEAKNTTPWRDDHAANMGLDVDGYERELTLWSCALPWIYARMEPRRGWTTPPRPQSALKHLRPAHSLLRKHGCSPPPLKHVAARCFKMMRRYLKENGSEALLPQQKEPFTTRMIVDMLASAGPTRGSGSRARSWDWSSHEGVTWRALVHTESQTGFRNGDITSKYDMTKRDLSMGHLKWQREQEAAPRVFTQAELATLKEGDFAVLTPPPSKSDPLGMRWGSKPIHLPYDPAAQICAARALRDLELMRQVPADERRSVPLFSDENGKPLSPSYTARTLRSFVELIVSKEFVNDYTMHSFRIYLCNALAAAGKSDATIQMMLRWASVDALNTYRLADAKMYADNLRAAAQATFIVRRGAQTMPTRASGQPMPRIDGDDRIAAIVEEAMSLLQIAEDHDDE